GGLSRLADIGIDVDTQGKLELDSGRLKDALSGNIEGVSPSDIRDLFGLNGTTSTQGLEFITGSDLTNGSGSPIDVDITQAAEQASVTGETALSETVVVDSSNNEFQITIDGVASETLVLAEGSYTRAEFAAAIESVINNSTELGPRDVTVSLDGDALNITTESYGLDSEVANVSGTAAGILGIGAAQSDNGQDVAGRFIVNGEFETAVGNGQILTGDSENSNTADVQVLVSLAPSQVSGVDGEVEGQLTVTRGISSRLDLLLDEFLDTDGTLSTINEEFDDQIESIDASIERINDITEARRAFLIAEFSALETALAELQNTGNILSSQFANLAAQ
ncbi:MAG: hypothetical protein AAGA30_04355, partial [Planctomycetota bacterium]